MLILGIDPGSSITAYGLIDSKTKKSDYGYIKLKKGLAKEEKVYRIFLYIKDILENNLIDSVALEDTFYSVNIQSAMLLSEIRASVIIAAKELNVRIYQYLPRQVKQAVCGYGGATKEQIKFLVENTLKINLSNQPLDVSDALGVALTHIYTLKL